MIVIIGACNKPLFVLYVLFLEIDVFELPLELLVAGVFILRCHDFQGLDHRVNWIGAGQCLLAHLVQLVMASWL